MVIKSREITFSASVLSSNGNYHVEFKKKKNYPVCFCKSSCSLAHAVMNIVDFMHNKLNYLPVGQHPDAYGAHSPSYMGSIAAYPAPNNYGSAFRSRGFQSNSYSLKNDLESSYLYGDQHYGSDPYSTSLAYSGGGSPTYPTPTMHSSGGSAFNVVQSNSNYNGLSYHNSGKKCPALETYMHLGECPVLVTYMHLGERFYYTYNRAKWHKY